MRIFRVCLMVIPIASQNPNSSAGWKEEGLGGSNARPPRVYGPAVFNDSDPHCNDISVYHRVVDTEQGRQVNYEKGN